MQRPRRPAIIDARRGARLAQRAAMLALLLAAGAAPAQQERRNYYGDPFVQVTAGLAGCPVPEGPLITAQEMREQAHGRSERGTSCHRSGRCRLPNAYLYDKEIIPRVRQYIVQDGSFADTSVWIMGQRRWVTLMGCVNSEAQRDALERAVRGIDDVEAVVDELMVGRSATPRYRTIGASAPAR